jgi:DivIVA domain-containing protein
MFDRQPGQVPPTGSTSAADTGSLPPERVMRIAPMDLRQQRFKKSLHGYDRTEVVAFLTEAADDYEHALREIDRLRQDLARMETLLNEHREREANLRNTLLTAQRLADEVRDSAHKEAELELRDAKGTAESLVREAHGTAEFLMRDAQGNAELLVREAQGRADLLLQKASNRLEEIERDINELRLRRRGVEGSLEASIQTLYHALEFIRDQDRPDDKVLLHRPRAVDAPAVRPVEPPRAADDRG